MAAAAIIVAAGRGQRLGSDLPKCFVELAGKPLFAWSLQAFAAVPAVKWAALVVPEGFEEQASQATIALQSRMRIVVTTGGAERPDSVLAGLRAVARWSPDVVAIHDGARPLVTPELIARCITVARQVRAAIAAAPSTDTLKRVENGRIVETLDRSQVWRAQTPQVFETGLVAEAYELAMADGVAATDDAALVERLGVRPAVVESDWTNLKITVPVDLAVAEMLLRARMAASEGAGPQGEPSSPGDRE